jgi:hypothetical protein
VELGGAYGGKDRLLRAVAQGIRPGQRFYLDSGGSGPSEPAQDNWSGTRRLRRQLIALGLLPGRDLLYRWAKGAGHDEAAWRARMEEVLRFFFPVGRR